MNHLTKSRNTKSTRLILSVGLPLLALLCVYALRPAGASAQEKETRNPALHQVAPVAAKSQSSPVFGLYRAIVISRPDPHMRVQIQIPSLNINGEWASACVPPGSTAAPQFNSQVWVMFEQGDTHLPVWMGTSPTM